MKEFRLFSIVFCLTLLISKVYGTAQIPDYLIYKGDTLAIYANPLESYFEKTERPDSSFEKYGYNSSACGRGYIGYWELRNDSLFLLKLRGETQKIDLSMIFKDRNPEKKIFADWVNQQITNPYGKQIYYVHAEYASIYEYERDFIIKKGILSRIAEYDNSKSTISKLTEKPELLRNYLQANINYSNIKNEPYERAKVIVKICTVSENGKIDSVEVLRGWDSERDKEAIRVVKSIPEWSVIYRRGKQIQIPWMIPIIFGKQNEK